MTAGAAFFLLGAQAIEQIAPATPPRAAASTEQIAGISDGAAIAQLPDDPRAVRQPLPRRDDTARPPSEIDRVAAVILSPGQATDPSRIGSELGPETIRRLARDVVPPVATGGGKR